MATLQDLRERHNTVAKQARELVEVNNSAWTAEHDEKYTAYMNELDEIA